MTNTLETSILKSMCYYPQSMQEFLHNIPREAFSKEGQKILDKMITLNDEQILNITTLESNLTESQKNSEFYIAFLNAPLNVNYLGEKKLFLHNYKLQSQTQIAQSLLKAVSQNEILDLDILISQTKTHSEFKNLTQWKDYYDREPIKPKFKTHISFLDSCFNNGIEAGQLVLISGDPEAGKTMLGTQILENIAKSHKVAFFCFEFTVRSYLESKEKHKINANNLIVINDEYNINDIAQNIKDLYKQQNVRVFLIDSQMRITSPQGRNMEEEESLKFSTLAKLCHSLDLLIFLIVQTSKGDRDNPMGSKKGGHEASIIMRIEHCKAKDENLREFSENERMLIVKKNKQNGKHFKEKVRFNPQTLYFDSIQREISQDAELIDKKEIETFLNNL